MVSRTNVPSDLNLLPGEEVVSVIRPVMKGFLSEFIGALLLVLLTAFFMLIWDPFGGLLPIWILGVLGLLCATLLIIGPFVNQVGHSYIITDRRVIGRFDFIVHRESTIYFEKVQNVKVRQGVFDNIVNTGTVTIETAAGAMLPEEKLGWILGPRDVRGHLMGLIEKHRGGSAGLGEPSSAIGADRNESDNHSLLSDILSELKGIRKDLGEK